MSDKPLSLADKLEHRLARMLLSLPHAVQLRLSGKPPVEVLGQRLHPEIQLLLSMRERRNMPGFSDLPHEKTRRLIRRDAKKHYGDPIPVGAVKDLTIEGADEPLRARHYAPPSGGKRPLLVFLHGGGFVVGDIDVYDSACRLLSRHADVHVLSVDYRLAPEHPFPAAVHDSAAAVRWAMKHAEELGADAKKVAVGGDSAGGNLSAVVSQLFVRAGEPGPVLQLLLYPAIDRRAKRPSLEHFAKGFYLTAADIEWFQQHYLGDGKGHDPLAAPLLEPTNLSGLPRAIVITAGFDPLRDEGEAYAEALNAAGTPAVLRRFSGFVHGFANFAGVSPASRQAVIDIATLLKQQLEETGS